jgi:PAS domain S-box-containing protein
MTTHSAASSEGDGRAIVPPAKTVGELDVRNDVSGILDALSLPVIVVDLAVTVVQFNRAATAMFGLSQSDIGQPASRVQALAHEKEIEKLCIRAMSDNVACRSEFQDAGRYFALHVAPCKGPDHQLNGAVITCNNVTAFRASVEQAIHEREYTKVLLNTVMVALVVLDSELRVQTANRAFYDLFGVSRETANGKPFLDPADQDPQLLSLCAALSATASNDTAFESFEFEREVTAAGCRTLLVDARRLSHDSNPTLLLAIQDVTERKRAQEALRRSDRRKDEFLAMLAHELRNPLAPVRNSLEIMKRAPENHSLMEKARLTIDRQMMQMERLVDDLLDISRITNDKLELRKARVELTVIIQQAVETFRPLAERAAHTLTVTIPPEPIYLDGDAVRLAQLFGNLLNNACKYTNRGGRIELFVERLGGDAIVSIKDSGVGIPLDMLDTIFDLFAQVDRSLERSQGGLGIGLTLVKRLVEMHGGTVQAFSEGSGRGSEFLVRLPTLADLETEAFEVGAGQQAAMERRVLVVDDNRDAAASLMLLLELMGHEVRSAADGVEAVEAVEKFAPDVVLLDIGLPKLSGYDVARLIREKPGGKRIMLIALTGWGQEEDRRKSAEAGFDVHLVKPIDLETLAKLLASTDDAAS